MNFKKRKIKNQLRALRALPPTTDPSPPKHNITSHAPSSHIHLAGLASGLIVIFILIATVFGLASSLDISSIVFSFGKDLKRDNHGQTNFLLLGVGGSEHDGSNLTDTIIVASLNQKQHTVKMLSLPRDLYIDNAATGGERINKIYDSFLHKYKSSSQAMTKLGQEITDITGIPIHYTVKVDFNGFVKIIDALGGVTVNVEQRIYDPHFPKDETIYFETFVLEAGPQKLDGRTALKYARSRKTTSDFDRAKRQQNLLAAIKEQALNIKLLSDPGKIQNLYNSVADSIDTNLSIAEILELAKISKNINRDQIDSRVISDDFTSCGGFLYTPSREFFAGASVLLPAGNNFDEIQQFSQHYFYNDLKLNPEIQVLNGTKVSGLAYTYLNRLSRECLNVVYYSNARDRDLKRTSIYYDPIVDENGQKQIPETSLQIIKKIINAPIIEGIPAEYLIGEKRINSKIVIEFGQDYKSLTTPDSFDNLLYLATPEETEESSETDTAEKPLIPADAP